MIWLVTAVVLAAENPTAPPRLWTNEVAVGVGVLGTGFAAVGGRVGDGSITPMISGRGITLSGFLVEGGALLSSPLSASGPYLGLFGLARVGWAWTRVAFSVGAVVQGSFGATPPVQVLPSLKVHWHFLPTVGASLGVLDLMGLVPVHLSAELGPFPFGRLTVGFVGPLGATVGADLSLPLGFGVRVSAFYYRIPTVAANAEFAFVAVAGTFGGRAR